ncbi:MAG: hypothetical protein PHS46_08540 [Candidatus Omnitrophica bacterium]|nr:hypothetical protein [Candidatus Omnitrophota bacterium]
MTRYKVKYKGKDYISRGENAEEAFERFANRQVFGQQALIGNYRLKMVDADTRGKEWALFNCGWPSESGYEVMVKLAEEGECDA